MHASELIVLGGVVVAGFFCQWISWRLRVPSILLLLLAGFLAGPVLGWLDPDALFGDLLRPIVALAVAVILYEGSVTLRFSEIRGHGAVVRNLVTLGVLVTWVTATLAAWLFLGWDIYLATLFGAIVTVSGPTVIVPLLRSFRPRQNLSSILRWEGILVDPLGAILAVLVFYFIVVMQTATTHLQLYLLLGRILLVGTLLGAAFGYAFGVALRRHWIPDFMRNYGALAVVILVFCLAESMAPESGLLAVTVMGIWQANMRGLDLQDILHFKESLTLVLVAALFILLASRVETAGLLELGASAFLVLLVLQFVATPLRALVSTIGSDLDWRERLYLGWIFPRGIVAAAVSALFALRLEQFSFPNSESLVPLVFTVIAGTVVIQSVTGKPLARWLRVADPEPEGVLIVGANPVALAFAQALKTAGRRVLVASMDWDGTRTARMAGLPVFYGSPVSTYAERHLELIGLGHLLALSHRPGLNELACVAFRHEFGRESVFILRQGRELDSDKYLITGATVGRTLYDGERSLDDIRDLLERGCTTRETDITDNFTYEDFRKTYPDAIMLFALDQNDRLHFPVGLGLRIIAGFRLVSLVPDETTT
ncbi:MAG: sodium:proton antiporter [Lysobacterales bacterium]|jgi:NhaP-type Na+/H+ or K+/H+ antiporter